ncbi:MAM33, mitochondrial matrix glycoprotein [Handroanthus impetiginosus]|uniref:MAM33, mitochondrial matrix glycoprotein n=1 Tax=Handroanthus impetiginosus TaxID=429701 RepID=A0A2G9GSD9_9LAMI|nr:MAM33, mitochondrial matrix glycoprotein [Handroanthus impetiginosus]
MALNNIIRRTASRVVPLAIRASTGRQGYFQHHTSLALYAAVNSGVPELSGNLLRRSFPSFHHHYSTKASSDESLVRVIESELQYAVESQEEDQAEDAPAGFPFKIEDHPGQQTVTLAREYQGETITVEVHMPDLVTGEENDDNDDDDEGEERANQSSIPLVVRVSKKGGPSLEFGCTAYPDEIAIDSLSVKDPESSEDQIAYEGPDFGDLDENLQKAFHKYLEIRGIKPSTTNFLHAYMVDKDNREYITWLKNLKKFVES